MCPAIPEPPGSNFRGRGESTRTYWRQELDDVGLPTDKQRECNTSILLKISRHAVQAGRQQQRLHSTVRRGKTNKTPVLPNETTRHGGRIGDSLLSTLYRLLNNGQLPGFKIESDWRFNVRQSISNGC
jgi:hypothetical protein